MANDIKNIAVLVEFIIFRLSMSSD